MGGFVNKQCLKKVDETNSAVKEVKQLPKKYVSLSTIKDHVQEKPVHLVTNVNHAKSSDMVLSTARKENDSTDHVHRPLNVAIIKKHNHNVAFVANTLHLSSLKD